MAVRYNTTDPSMWVEQPDSGRWSESSNGQLTYTLKFRADRDRGRQMASSKGYRTGMLRLLDGDKLLVLDQIDVNRSPVHDDVDIVYRAADNKLNYPTGSVDGKIHREGDHEFIPEGTIQPMRLSDAVAKGWISSSSEYEGYADSETVDVPVMTVVWKTWLAKFGTKEENGRTPALPNTSATCMDLVESCFGSLGSLSDGPKLNKKVSWSTQLKCTDIRFSDDGALMLREARLAYLPHGNW